MTRRRLLLGLAAAAWPDRLGVMCQLGDSESNARSVLAAARTAGYRNVQISFSWDRVDAAFLKGLPAWVRGEGLNCVALGAYVNCAAPSAVLMNTRAEDFSRALDYAAELNCPRLVSWTGSYGGDLMKPDPRNFAPGAAGSILRFLQPHLKRIAQAKLQLALETYVTLVCPDATSLRRLLNELPLAVGAVLDPPNLTPPARFAARDDVLRDMVRTLAGRITVVHLKDFKLTPAGGSYELPGPLAGQMNYPLFLAEINNLPGDVPVIAEHISPAEFTGTRTKLLDLIGKNRA
jgi:sugar phosphate isomerase/epimerase